MYAMPSPKRLSVHARKVCPKTAVVRVNVGGCICADTYLSVSI